MYIALLKINTEQLLVPYFTSNFTQLSHTQNDILSKFSFFPLPIFLTYAHTLSTQNVFDPCNKVSVSINTIQYIPKLALYIPH